MPALLFTDKLSERATIPRKEDLGSTAPVRNLSALLERCEPAPQERWAGLSRGAQREALALPGSSVPTRAALAPFVPEARDG